MLRRWIWIGGTALLAFAITLISWRLIAGPSWSDAVDAGTDVLKGRDAESASYFIDEEELRALHISRAESVPILKLIARDMKPFTVSPSRSTPVIHGAKIVVTFDVSGAKGNFHSGIEVFDTVSGPRISLGLLGLNVLRGIMAEGKASPGGNWREQFNTAAEGLKLAGLPGYWDIASGKIQEWPRLKTTS